MTYPEPHIKHNGLNNSYQMSLELQPTINKIDICPSVLII
ncbi:hypothetical protein DDB_G0277069 [Dictyostelium discoideum AX4]|uniref:Uncharacterized protein n=1 Tax=Dictyostelium discoideum TaxID=44689 RepID=Q550L1_DICDI|nr:hypothetical protein DDB_G0277069 [Dictyostelium discoideum AX4]EAL69036.1 hypothetical protein DDB_G0277069 [Dictyostelium discoideum AX4]|eukprot:XP_642921.1 hypothetical protein DDB_G0277069 [Dictyostelium discoideum AX4]